jgi:hypothetical protein
VAYRYVACRNMATVKWNISDRAVSVPSFTAAPLLMRYKKASSDIPFNHIA